MRNHDPVHTSVKYGGPRGLTPAGRFRAEKSWHNPSLKKAYGPIAWPKTKLWNLCQEFDVVLNLTDREKVGVLASAGALQRVSEELLSAELRSEHRSAETKQGRPSHGQQERLRGEKDIKNPAEAENLEGFEMEASCLRVQPTVPEREETDCGGREEQTGAC